MQTGTIRKRGKTWVLRFYEPVLVDGEVVKRPCTKRLAKVSEKYFTEESVRPLADLILAPINANTARPESSQTVIAFLEHVYLPMIETTKKPSTYYSYAEMFRLVKPHLGELELRATRTSDVDRIIKSVADSKPRAHTTLRNVKSFLSGGFRYAKRTDMIHDNPVRDSVVPRGKSRGETKAYTLEEIQLFLQELGEPARTAVLVAAMTGLRVSEVMGLRWEDVVGDELRISRSVWCGEVRETKTLSSRAPVPLLPIIKKALVAHRRRSVGDGYIFAARNGQPMRLENVTNRNIKPALKKAKLRWYGWHAFRRGVGTNLHTLGVDDTTISNILRHGNVAVTQQFYMKPVAKTSRKAMKKLERALKKAK